MFTELYTTVISTLKALTVVLKVAPLFMDWKITSECEGLTNEILKLETDGSASARERADGLRIKLAYRRQLHAALLASNAGDSKGDGNPDKAGSV